jgi:excisionase family DNA binding protein
MHKKPRTVTISEFAVESRLLRLAQAAAYLSCTIWQVRSLIWSRQLPAIKLGRRLLIDRTDLDRFVENKKTEAAGRAA